MGSNKDNDTNTIDIGEEFDIATPLPTPSFSVGSPIATIAPYASLVSIQCGHNDTMDTSMHEIPVQRGRSATISGPLVTKHFHHRPAGGRSAPHFSVDNLDIVIEGRDMHQQQEAMPYIEAVGSMGNIHPPPLPQR